MTKSSEIFRALAHRLGVAGPACARQGARLRAFGGTGASKTTRGTGAFVVGLVLYLCLGLTSSAFAAAPEAPTTEAANPVFAGAATLNGVLFPASEPEAGSTYEFLYKATATASRAECESVGASKAPVSAGLALAEGQAVSEPVTGLTPNTKYVVCLAATNAEVTPVRTVGAPVRFTTAITPETPVATQPKPQEIAATTATLNGVLNPGAPGNPGSYEFLYKQSATECKPTVEEEGEGIEQKTAPKPATHALGGKGEVADAPITELLANTRYTFCLRAKNEAGEETLSTPVTFRTLPDVYATNLTASSATLHAVLNPEGSSLSYHFEYGTGTTYGLQTPQAGTSLTEVEAHIQNLSAATLYHYRVIATNAANETFESEDHTFTTQHTIGAFALPDGRQYEMVTPPQKEGALFTNLGREVLIKVSVNGDAIADGASQPTEAEPQGYDEPLSVLSTRGPGGWSSQDIEGEHDEFGGVALGEGTESRAFSEDLSHMVVQQLGNFTPLSPAASEPTPYLRTNYFNQNVSEHCEGSYLTTSSCFLPLVTKANTRPGADFGEVENGLCPRYFCGPHFVLGTPDLSHLILRAGEYVQLTASGTTGGEYEWSGGKLQPLPGYAASISADGGRVILYGSLGLELFEVATEKAVKLGGGGGTFEMANSDDSRIFFREGGEGGGGTYQSEGGDLYEYDLEKPEGERLTDLTVDPNAGESANVEAVLGVSEDGSYVYFAAGGALAPGAVPDGCHPTGGSENVEGCNLYVRHDGVTRLVAPGWWRASNFRTRESSEFVRVSPDGRYLAFISSKSLTGYDNHDAASGQSDAEVYLYHAETSPSGTLAAGKLVCASCDPTGARPVGVDEETDYPAAATAKGWTAASTTGEQQVRYLFSEPQGGYLRQTQVRYLSDGGRLFFDSFDALVPQDVNGVEDVYEYEPEGLPAGEHACSAASTSGSEVFKPARAFQALGVPGEEGAGCVALISSGTSSEPSSLLGASASGGDVFFLTNSKLAPQDFDSALDVYDAHECTTQSPCSTSVVAPPACTTEASCKPPPTPQPSIYGLPASATFSGPGNLTPGGRELNPIVPKKVTTKKTLECKKRFTKQQNKCVRNRKSKRAKKATNDRRASR